MARAGPDWRQTLLGRVGARRPRAPHGPVRARLVPAADGILAVATVAARTGFVKASSRWFKLLDLAPPDVGSSSGELSRLRQGCGISLTLPCQGFRRFLDQTLIIRLDKALTNIWANFIDIVIGRGYHDHINRGQSPPNRKEMQ